MIKGQTKQTNMKILLKRLTPPQEEPLEGPWGGIPEGGIVIIGQDSSRLVIVPKTFQWDKMGGGGQGY